MSSVREEPVIVSYYGNDPIGKILSNFANTPFTLDNTMYASVEGFWQGMKTIDPAERHRIAGLYGMDAKVAGQHLRSSSQLIVYGGRMYRVASEAHHRLLDRALRAKFTQHADSAAALVSSGTRPLRHMIINKYGQHRTGDSPALPAVVFENMLTAIRKELIQDRAIQYHQIPAGL